MPRFKLVFFSPLDHTQRMLSHLFHTFPQHVGRIGQYDSCAFLVRGTGQFRPLSGANPTVGSVGALETVEEHRAEVLVHFPPSSSSGPVGAAPGAAVSSISEDKNVQRQVREVIAELKKVHPYEEAAYEVYRIEDF